MKRRLYQGATRQANQQVEKLLGELESQIMCVLWQGEETTVREIVNRLNEERRRPLAYTTVLTVMTRLVNKGLLKRSLVGKTHYYEPAQTREQFLQRASGAVIRALVADFGEVAIAQFLAEIERVDPATLERLRRTASDQAGIAP